MKNYDLTFVLDHMDVDCGVRTRYMHVLNYCVKVGLKVAVIADGKPLGVAIPDEDWLTIKVDDFAQRDRFRRRPFLDVSANKERNDAIDANIIARQHGMSVESAEALDAWMNSTDWIRPTIDKILNQTSALNSKKTVIATQSFLGFAAMHAKLDRPVVSFHTNYPAAYGARLAGENSEFFETVQRAVSRRIAENFLHEEAPLAFVSAHGIMPELLGLKSDRTHFLEFPGGVDTKVFVPSSSAQTSPKLRVLFVGRLTEEKGVGLLMTVANRLDCFHWTIIGDGPCRSRLENGMPNAVFLGNTSQEIVASELALADIFFFPGRYDTFGMCALEAMAAAVPVIAVKGSGIANRIQRANAGLVVETDEEAITAAFIDLRKGAQLREKLGQNGRRYAESMSWDAVCNTFLSELGCVELDSTLKPLAGSNQI